jgi:flagellar hook assembly protein FlgD
LKIFTILGQDVAILESGIKNSGKHQVFWDGKDQTGREVSAGIYFYRLTAVPVNNGDTVIQTKKMVMNK